MQAVDYRTFRLCKVVQGNSKKFHDLVAAVMSVPEHEQDTMVQMMVAHGEGGPDRRLTLGDVWEVHMPTRWYIQQLEGTFDGETVTIEKMIERADEYHAQFMVLKDSGQLEGKTLEWTLDIMDSYVILTALPQEWNPETKHTCICKSFFKHGACEHSAGMAMLMDRRVKIPGNAIVKKLQSRPRMGGRSPVTAVGRDEESAFSKDKRSYKLPTVRVVE